MGFLLDRNRINVAVSRAQWLAVVVRSPALTTYMPTSVGELLDLGAFVGLCETVPQGRCFGTDVRLALIARPSGPARAHPR